MERGSSVRCAGCSTPGLSNRQSQSQSTQACSSAAGGGSDSDGGGSDGGGGGSDDSSRSGGSSGSDGSGGSSSSGSSGMATSDNGAMSPGPEEASSQGQPPSHKMSIVSPLPADPCTPGLASKHVLRNSPPEASRRQTEVQPSTVQAACAQGQPQSPGGSSGRPSPVAGDSSIESLPV
jgi:hypothetical protein